MDSAPSTRLRVNGMARSTPLEARRTLLEVLREDLDLTGAKKACDMGNCGACTVLVDGRAVYSCLVLAIDCAGAEVVTIEGIGSPGTLDPVQQAFIDADAFQCGFCTPGQIMSVKALLQNNPNPSDADIVHALSGNLCRCGAYRHILHAARIAAGHEPDTTIIEGAADGSG